MYKILSNLGRALMLPIAILPAAGLLLGIGSAFTSDGAIRMFPILNNIILSGALNIMKVAGNAVFANIAFLFAIGIAVGFANEDKGTAGIAGGISFMIYQASIDGFMNIFYLGRDDVIIDTGVLGAICVGAAVAYLHNRFHKIQLPTVLGFFGGSRFVPIICSLAAILLAFVFSIFWPPIGFGLQQLGQLIAKIGPIGSFLYGFSMRLCGALGLHHVLYPMFWYTDLGGTEVVNGETISGAQNIYFAQLADPNFEGMYTYGTRFFAGRFATMMFGIPACALAMYHSIPKKNRKNVKSLYSSGALTSFLTGITEPIEYCFLFVAPWLYFIHCLLDGVSFLIADLLCIRIGNAFSAGLIDFTLFGILQGNAATNWILVIPIGIAWAALYYVVFRLCLKIKNVAIPGMNENDGLDDSSSLSVDSKNGSKTSNKEEKLHNDCLKIIEALGAQDNIEKVMACATRLRVTVKDAEKVNDDALKVTGALAVIKKGGGIQAVYGTKADLLSTEINSILGG